MTEINPYHNTHADKRSPFMNKGDTSIFRKGVKPAKTTREQVLKLAADLSRQYQNSGQLIRHKVAQLTGLYNGTSNPLHKRLLLPGRIKARPAYRPPATLKNSQVGILLARFDYIFKFWGIRFPLGMAKGRHMWSDDIANAARLAFFKAFIPHCNLGHVDCSSQETTTRKVIRTATGRIKRKMQPVLNEAGEKVGSRLKPVYRIKKAFTPSCEKAAIFALSAAKYAAMQSAREFTKHGLKETVFSSLDLKPGQSLVELLESLGENPVDFANSLGISSPWVDQTLQSLADIITTGNDMIMISHYGIAQAVAKCSQIDGRLDRALQIADRRKLLDAVFLRANGLEWPEVAFIVGLKPSTLQMRIKRMQSEVSRIKATS